MMPPDRYLDALLSLPRISAAQVSPDGRWVAWTWSNTGLAADVFAAPADGSSTPLRLTETPHDTILTSWTPDSRAVLVAQDRDGDERAQLFLVQLDQPGVMRPLTEPAPPYFLRGGQLHPNGRWLVYGANYDFSAGKEIEPTWLYRQDLETGERRVLARPERASWVRPHLNLQGTYVLYHRSDLHPAGRQVWLVDVEGTHDREILNFGPAVKVSASWLPDGERAIVLAEAATHRRVGLWELGSGALRWLLDDPDRNVESVYVPYGSMQAVVVEVKNARSRASLLDVETGRETALPAVPGDLIPLAPAGAGAWVAGYCSAQQPGDPLPLSPPRPRPQTFARPTPIRERPPPPPGGLA